MTKKNGGIVFIKSIQQGSSEVNMAEARASSSLGGYDDEFVKEIDEDWQCGICQLPMREPIQTKCGHRFCIQCLNGYFTRLVSL